MFRLAIFYQNAGETQNDTLPFSLLLKSPPPVVNVCAGKSHSVTRIFITNVLDRSQENHSVEDRPQCWKMGRQKTPEKVKWKIENIGKIRYGAWESSLYKLEYL